MHDHERGGRSATTAEKERANKAKDQQRARQRRRAPARTLRILQLNCRGVRAMEAELKHVVGTYEPDVIMLQETFLKKGLRIPRLDGYDSQRRDRRVRRRLI